MLKTNCDIGERGVAHPIDDQLMQHIDIANIACGGHAGDTSSIAYYQNLANKNNIMVTAHLSYPDVANFGRVKMDISTTVLINSLTEQYQRLPVGKIKFHGALYHEANTNDELAQALANWMQQQQLNLVLTPDDSLLANHVRKHKITVMAEAFIERGYQQLSNGKLNLIPRGQAGAELDTVTQALAQYQQIQDGALLINSQHYPIIAQSACIHSDSAIALELAQAIRKLRH
jgi:lactam utilization protein B